MRDSIENSLMHHYLDRRTFTAVILSSILTLLFLQLDLPKKSEHFKTQDGIKEHISDIAL